jgi:hypothetical protein
MSSNDINAVEQEIDAAFASNALKSVPWTQSAWTILSVVEDHHFKIAVMQPLPEREAAIYVDGLINAMTYPLRVLHAEAPRAPASLNRRYLPEQYDFAFKWLDAAEEYTHFCSIFPLYHAKEIDLTVSGEWIEPTDWSKKDLSYEVYDRFVAKRDPEQEARLDSNAIVGTLRTCIRSSGGRYSIDFSRQLLEELDRHFAPAFHRRHVLPEDWEFSRFTLAQYRAIFVGLQITAEAWFAARQIVAPYVPGSAYESSVWTPRKGKLVKLMARHTRLPVQTVQSVLEYLTFGEVGVRNPDAAIQPLVDLGNDHYGISPFLLTQVHAERNLCVLLNQVPADRKLYAALVEEKEGRLRAETIQSLQSFGLDFKHGDVGSTDVDLAVIDHAAQVCLCIELKWFIEPAEIREVLMRSKELQRGVSQAKVLHALYVAKDARLFALLGIDEGYEFQAIVGSVNSVGRPGIQDPQIPIAKLWHVVSKVKETRSLRAVVQWLRLRAYLPVKGQDYKVQEVPVQCGKWKSRWYGIAYA